MALRLRLHARFPCRIRARLRWPGLRQPVAAELRDLGMGGALIRVRAEVPDAGLELELPAPRGTLVLRSSVARRLGEDPADPSARLYALDFHTPFSEKHKLLQLVDRVRGPKR